jgi:hypothetical protein
MAQPAKCGVVVLSAYLGHRALLCYSLFTKQPAFLAWSIIALGFTGKAYLNSLLSFSS